MFAKLLLKKYLIKFIVVLEQLNEIKFFYYVFNKFWFDLLKSVDRILCKVWDFFLKLDYGQNLGANK